jgi:hypothetical protein
VVNKKLENVFSARSSDAKKFILSFSRHAVKTVKGLVQSLIYTPASTWNLVGAEIFEA